MITQDTRNRYKVAIGIECHVQLMTRTKLFSAAGNDARTAEPNTLINHIDLGMPGALPVLNRQAVELGMKAAFVLGSEPQKYSAFDRKHYFYPDLPMGYQITQFYNPIIKDGHVEFEFEGQKVTIRIHEAHLESDAGKSTHPAGQDYSLIDYNRAGTPLLEIVSEPDIHSPQVAKMYAKELYLRMRYAGVSDCNLYYGNMRFDVNVSVSTTDELGTRTETKNLNSFKSVERAAEYEIVRQIELLEKGEPIVQETRGWDDAGQKTFSQRGKEQAHDYRYMPDPDIPPIVLSDDWIDSVRDHMPATPSDWRSRLLSIGLDESQMDVLLESEVQRDDIDYLRHIEAHMDQPELARFLANWYVNVMIPIVDSDQFKLVDAQHILLELEIHKLINGGMLSSTNAKSLFLDIASRGELPASLEDYARDNGLLQMSDGSQLDEIVAQVLQENPGAVADIKNGEQKAIGFLVGQIMKLSKGQANPALAQQIILKHLDITID